MGIDINKIKRAINLNGSLVIPNPDGTVMIIPPSLNYLEGIPLNVEEYQRYVKATTLSIEEKMQRLEN